MKLKDPIKNFWSHVNKNAPNGCWEWTRYRQKFGYGMAQIGMGLDRTHRISWRLANGPIPDGMCVLHKCDNPACVNPDHLFLGTRADNVRDMRQKGRERHPGHPDPSKDILLRRGVCIHGHVITPETTYYRKNGKPECLLCRRISALNQYFKHQAVMA